MNYNGADYNAFGYDPEGRIAAVAAYFYGPAWQPVHSQPVHSHGIPWPTGCIIGPPRYGPPVPWQIPLLPNNFIACLPPLLHWTARCISARPKHVQHHKLCSPFSYLAKLTPHQQQALRLNMGIASWKDSLLVKSGMEVCSSSSHI